MPQWQFHIGKAKSFTLSLQGVFKYSVSIFKKGSVFLSLNIFFLPIPFISFLIRIRRIITDPCLPPPVFSPLPTPLHLLPFPSHAFSIRVALYILFCSCRDKQWNTFKLPFLKYTEVTHTVKPYMGRSPYGAGSALSAQPVWVKGGKLNSGTGHRNRLRKGRWCGCCGGRGSRVSGSPGTSRC